MELELREILRISKCSVTISVNPHRDCYESVEDHIYKLSEIGGFNLIEDIGLETYDVMKKLNRIVCVTVYPDTPIGSYEVFHYDLDEAVKIMRDILKNNKSK